jgi:hypothetical protein
MNEGRSKDDNLQRWWTVKKMGWNTAAGQQDSRRDWKSSMDDRRDGMSRTAVETGTVRWTSSEEIRTACRRCWLENEDLKINTVLGKRCTMAPGAKTTTAATSCNTEKIITTVGLVES